MPALPDASKVLRCAFRQTVQGQSNINVFHVKYDGAGGNQSDLDSLANDLGNNWATAANAIQDADAVNDEITVVDLTSATALTSVQPLTGHGTHSGGMTPANCALCVSWKIHRRYRGGHPRNYIGGIPITAYDDERAFSTTFAGLALSGFDTFRTSVPGITGAAYGNLKLVSLSYYHDKAIRAVPVTDDITATAVDRRPDSQRRRLGKVAG
jgi:hypothetical protein